MCYDLGSVGIDQFDDAVEKTAEIAVEGHVCGSVGKLVAPPTVGDGRDDPDEAVLACGYGLDHWCGRDIAPKTTKLPARKPRWRAAVFSEQAAVA
ncbi:MAG: hypothetical protein L0271_12225 [Gemmatimonadetes bacterium]|nr:hypothetical protein [Gemmatimonadota bacterium]